MTSIRTAALVCAVAALAAAPVMAQGYGSSQSSKMSMQGPNGTMSEHQMPATVTSIDRTTGIVNVTSEGKSLKLHFPPSALTNIKAGDKVKIELGISKT